MVYVISILLILYVVYNVHKFKLYNPYKVTLVCGQKGSGKSTYACSVALKYLNKKFYTWDSGIKKYVAHRWHVYTNMHMQLDGVYYLEYPEKIGQMTVPPYSVLIFDEINTLPGWDNRDFKNMAATTIKWMRYSRQYKVRCFFCLRPGTVTRRSKIWLTKFLYAEILLLSLLPSEEWKKELQSKIVQQTQTLR